MVDVLTKDSRSYCMSRIKAKDTKPELVVRKILSRNGYRYRLYLKDIIGKPDLAFIGRKKLIFVHGCFWHRHAGCKYAYSPKSNVNMWQEKFKANVRRDIQVMEKLKADGWQLLIVWECETRNQADLTHKLLKFMETN